MLFGLLLGPRRPALDVDALYRDYAGLVQRRVLRFFKDNHEAEEVTHEIFLRVMEKRETFQGEASPSTWLYALTTRYCINRIRNLRRRRELATRHGGQPWEGPAMPADAESRAFLSGLWAELDEELALVGVHYFVDGLTHGEIARIVGLSRRTIGARIERLRQLARHAAGLENHQGAA